MDRYEEALAKARAEYEKAREQGYTWLMNLLEGMFPDLKESEDERIRKELVAFFKEVRGDYWHDLLVADILAYLEKEQKFTEKQDYSDLTDLERAIHRGFLVVGVENVPVTIIKETAQDCLAWMKPQKGANGNEKEIPNEQKPAEWSEEDTEMHINVASSLRGYACGLENEEHKKHIKKELDWLENRFKSLSPKPHWKPSEEQMGMLLAVINDPNNAGAESCHLMLQSLYADLEKL